MNRVLHTSSIGRTGKKNSETDHGRLKNIFFFRVKDLTDKGESSDPGF